MNRGTSTLSHSPQARHITAKFEEVNLHGSNRVGKVDLGIGAVGAMCGGGFAATLNRAMPRHIVMGTRIRLTPIENYDQCSQRRTAKRTIKA